jgi:GH25 family lysozyme M1 (1,4-beta-N-acetylmuramidase)
MTEMIERPIVDLSHHQPPDHLNWAQARAAGIIGAIFKAGQGSHSQDSAFVTHMFKAFEAGVPLLGGYLFLDDSNPQAQANNLLKIMKDDLGGILTDRLIAIDVEKNPSGATATIDIAAAVAQEIFNQINRWPVLYMGRFGPDGAGTDLPHDILDNCDLWLPAYGAVPRLPKGFLPPGESPAVHGGQLRLWQDTDGTMNHGEPVPGLGRVDQSRPMGFDSLEELQAWWGK